MPTSIASEIAVSLGLLSTVGALKPIKNKTEEKEKSTFYVTPCEHHCRVGQFYIPLDCACRPATEPNGYKSGELMKGKEVGGKVEVFTPDEVKDAKASDLEKNTLSLMVSPAAEFERQTWATGNAYFFEPKRLDAGYKALVTLGHDRTKAVYGPLVLRSEALYRLVPGADGGIALQECLTPQEMWHYEVEPVELTEKEALMAELFADAAMEPFDPETVRDKTVDRIRQLVASRTGDAVVAPVVQPKGQVDVDLTSALEKALLAMKAAKAS